MLLTSVKFISTLAILFAFLVSLASSDYAEFFVADSSDLEYDEEESIGTCGEGQFECRNGECIQRNHLCDGRADCSDLSDETRSECTRMICPNAAFRCDYGACVPESSICNGAKDCIDNSDELLPKCPRTSLKLARVPQTVFFTVYDDQRDRGLTLKRPRIYRIRIPNSEVTRTLALGQLRPSIPSNALTTLTPLTPLTSIRTLTPLATLISSMSLTSFCLVPPQPLNGQWKLHKSFCKGNENCDIPQGISLQPGSVLVYSCSRNFMPRGNTDVYCGDEGNWSSIPVCIVTTCAPLNSISRAATCSRFGSRVSCRSPVLPYTRARVTCRINYGPDPIFSPFVEQSVLCHLDGRWGPEPITCSPVCGVVDDSALRLSTVNGITTEVGTFPWHANLWKEIITPEGAKVEFRCSATIVQTHFVVTAAHCVVDEILGTTEDPRYLRVTAGNTYGESDGRQNTPWIVQKVKNVYRYCEYFGLAHNYISDIAVVELLDPMEFSSAVLPACLDVSRYSEEFFRPGVSGRIAGFGRKSISTPSPVLQTVKVTYATNRECRAPYNPLKGDVVISDDEFCGVYANESTVCDWDSGGGFVAKKGGLWHLLGIFIMDLGLQGTETTCGENPYSLYTKVSPYMAWIQDLMFQLRRYKTYPVCNFLPTPPTPSIPTIISRWTTTMRPSIITSDTPTTPSPPTSTTLDPVDIRTSPTTTSFSCLVPPQPANGEWQLHPDLCNSTDCNLPSGALLGPGSQLVYSCNPGFRIQGNAAVFCSAKGRWSPLPTCIEITCGSLETVSRSATCFRMHAWVPCNSTALPNTRAVIKCRLGYREDTSSLKSGSETVECNRVGEWEPNPITCVPVCGMTNTRLTPTILNGSSADITEFPWHATLYRQMNVTQGSKEFICGATIIQNNLLMTAAHCVYDDVFKTVQLPELFSVAAGNKFRDYDSPLHDPRVVQKSAVKNIYVPCEYYGLEGNYASDIALIELREPFQLSDILSPACLDVLGNNEQILEPGSVGKFAGFGRTGLGPSSAGLLSANIPYVSYSQCRMSQTGDGNLALIGKDKFCGGTIGGMAVCQGDSGGGLAFNNGGSWNVMGVLSVNLGVDTSSGERTCNGNAYSLYTKVSSHIPWIRNVMFHLEKDKAYPSCGSK